MLVFLFSWCGKAIVFALATSLHRHVFKELSFYDLNNSRFTAVHFDSMRQHLLNLFSISFRLFKQVTTTDDPIIRKLAKSCGNVFATDAILATLMCATRSQYSWDIIAQRVGRNKLFFDKRDDSTFDLLTVSETANEPPQVVQVLLQLCRTEENTAHFHWLVHTGCLGLKKEGSFTLFP